MYCTNKQPAFSTKYSCMLQREYNVSENKTTPKNNHIHVRPFFYASVSDLCISRYHTFCTCIMSSLYLIANQPTDSAYRINASYSPTIIRSTSPTIPQTRKRHRPTGHVGHPTVAADSRVAHNVVHAQNDTSSLAPTVVGGYPKAHIKHVTLSCFMPFPLLLHLTIQPALIPHHPLTFHSFSQLSNNLLPTCRPVPSPLPSSPPSRSPPRCSLPQ